MTPIAFLDAAPQVAIRLQQETQALSEALAALPGDAPARSLLMAGERLSLWTEVAGALDLDALRDNRETPDASRYGCLGSSVVAADNAARALQYIDAIAGPRRPGLPRASAIGASTDLETLTNAHGILHHAGLNTVTEDGHAVVFTPGLFRKWPKVMSDARTGSDYALPEPEEIPILMDRWSQAFSPDRWEGQPAVLRAAQAYASLQAIAPYPDGNGRLARAVALAILHEDGQVTALPAMLERHRPRCTARLCDALVSGDLTGWSRAFTTMVVEGSESLRGAIEPLKSGVIALARHINPDADLSIEDRHQLALSMITQPVDRAHAFAARHKLDRATSEAILKPLVRAGHLEIARIGGQQVLVNQTSLEVIRRLARPEPGRCHDLTAQTIRPQRSCGDAR